MKLRQAGKGVVIGELPEHSRNPKTAALLVTIGWEGRGIKDGLKVFSGKKRKHSKPTQTVKLVLWNF